MRTSLALLLLACLLAGCSANTPSPTPQATSTPAAATQEVVFEHETLPDQVESLSGTALLSPARDLAARIDAGDGQGEGFFLLLSPTAPDKGVIVRAGPKLTPEQLENLQSSVVKVSGPVKTLEDPELAGWFQERFDVTVASRDGKVQWIDNQADLGWDVAPETPAAEG